MCIRISSTVPLSAQYTLSPAIPEETNDPARMNQLRRLTEWRDSFGTDFVAHGIFVNNVEAVLKDGRLRCAENVLRRTKKLEFEGGTCAGSRENIYLPENPVPEFAEEVEKVKKEILDAFNFTDADIEKTLRFIDIDYKVQTKYPRKRDDFQSLPDLNSEECRYRAAALDALSLLPGEYKKNLFEFESYLTSVGRYFYEKYRELWTPEHRPRELYAIPLLAIYIDEALPKQQRHKALLGRIFMIYQKMIDQKEIEVGLVELRPFLHNLRKWRLADPYKISEDIRVFKNTFESCYGRVRILIGGTEKIIGSVYQTDTGEYYLLSPGQNGGKFFKVDLSSSNVLIIGPKEVLNIFADDPRFGKNIVFSENGSLLRNF